MVFLHGMTLDSRSWTGDLAALGQRHAAYAYDLRGFGRSPVAAGTVVDHVADLAGLIAGWGLERPILVGLSLGANIAMAYALAHGDALGGVVLASPGLPGYRWTGERPPTVAAERARSAGVAAAKAYWLGHPLFASLADRDEARRAVREMVDGYDGWHWLNPARVTPLPAVADRLDALTLPVLVVNGARDLDEYRTIGRLIAARAPNARHVELEGAGHVVNLERPHAFRTLVEQFVAVVTGGQAQHRLPPPIGFTLSAPGTFLYSGPDSTRGFALNRFALSLKTPENRYAFLADEAGYIARFGLSAEQAEQVRARDWTGLLRGGGHLQAILKLAATVGQSLWDIGAHNAGIGTDAMIALCPRRVSCLPGDDEGAA
ncbi:MAG TPA: alpha/beta fold hydrolase [Sphingomonadaceae bacterium]|nr:alpha/beta fold hydrolase [Sphingomonadaceae bacterium]